MVPRYPECVKKANGSMRGHRTSYPGRALTDFSARVLASGNTLQQWLAEIVASAGAASYIGAPPTQVPNE
jgi:hypothetical protein